MSNKQKLTQDEWLHILTSAVANYAAAGGGVTVRGGSWAGLGPVVTVSLHGVSIEDDRLHPEFVALVDSEPDMIDLILKGGA